MVPGKKVVLEGCNFIIGLPTGGSDKSANCVWTEALKYRSQAPQIVSDYGTICREGTPNGRCVIRGDVHSPSSWYQASTSVISYIYGFRPVLYPHRENLKPDTKLLGEMPNGTILRAYTLFMGDDPIRTDADVPQICVPNRPLRFSDEYVGDEYLIPWLVIEGCAISARVLLTHVSWNDLCREGFVR